jgi:hypothetical protein
MKTKSRDGDVIDDFAEQISSAAQAWTDHQLRDLVRVGEIIKESGRRWNAALEKAKEIGEWGWTVPLGATLSEYIALVMKCKDVQASDATFTRFYTADESSRLDHLKHRLLFSSDLGLWRPLLEEAIFCLDNHKLRACVAALLPTIDGVTAVKFSEPEFHRRSGRHKFFRTRLEATKPESIEYYEWSSYQAFIEELFKRFDFNKRAPTRLNRHWILHGRNIPSGNLSDCLRLLQAIETILGR